MTLPSSGSISAQQIDKTLFRTSGNAFSLNDSDGRTLTGNVSGSISYSSFYGLTNTNAVTFSTPGSFTYTVPNQVTNLTMIYPTSYGNASVTINWVTPGQIISGVIGGIGSGSSFGNVNTPVIDAQVFYINALVNSTDEYMFTVVANTSTAYSGSNVPANLTSLTHLVGIDFIASQTNFGIEPVNVTMTPIPLSTVAITGISTTQLYVSSFSSNSSGAYYTFVTSPNSPALGIGNETKGSYQTTPNNLTTIPYTPPTAMQNSSSSNGSAHLGYGGSDSTISSYVSTLLLYNTATTGLVVTETPTYHTYGNATYTTYTESNVWYPNAYSFSANINVRNIVPITIVASA